MRDNQHNVFVFARTEVCCDTEDFTRSKWFLITRLSNFTPEITSSGLGNISSLSAAGGGGGGWRRWRWRRRMEVVVGVSGDPPGSASTSTVYCYESELE